MSTRVKKNDIRSSLFDEVDMQQRAIVEARVSHALEMGGALKRGREEQKIADARALIAEGLDKALVCRVLKLSPEELNRLLHECNQTVDKTSCCRSLQDRRSLHQKAIDKILCKAVADDFVCGI